MWIIFYLPIVELIKFPENLPAVGTPSLTPQQEAEMRAERSAYHDQFDIMKIKGFDKCETARWKFNKFILRGEMRHAYTQKS